MRIGIAVDSCCDLPADFITQHGIEILPISLRIGETLIEDRRRVDETLAFYREHLDARSEDHAESIPFPQARIEALFLDRLVREYDYVFCLTITPQRSAIFDHAQRASLAILSRYREPRREAGLPERFGLCVLSSRNLFTGQAVQAAEAVRLVRGGATPSQIGERLRAIGELTHAYLMPDDLYYLYKRASRKGDKSISWGSYAVGSMLDVKPILHCHRDNTGPVAKVRGFDKGVSRLFEMAAQQIERGLEAPVVAVSYGGDPDTVVGMPGFALLSQAADVAGVQVLVSPMSKTAAVNVGAGGVSIAFAASDHQFH